MEKFIHSVTLDKDLCKGCINCIKRCPTEAIRVRDGKAHILAERCIDCGECIRICPYKLGGGKAIVYLKSSKIVNGSYSGFFA